MRTGGIRDALVASGLFRAMGERIWTNIFKCTVIKIVSEKKDLLTSDIGFVSHDALHNIY